MTRPTRTVITPDLSSQATITFLREHADEVREIIAGRPLPSTDTSELAAMAHADHLAEVVAGPRRRVAVDDGGWAIETAVHSSDCDITPLAVRKYARDVTASFGGRAAEAATESALREASDAGTPAHEMGETIPQSRALYITLSEKFTGSDVVGLYLCWSDDPDAGDRAPDDGSSRHVGGELCGAHIRGWQLDQLIEALTAARALARSEGILLGGAR